MKKLLALAVILIPTLALAASAPPKPVIVVIDRAAILRDSKVGQDIARQVQTYSEQAKKDLSSRGKTLQEEGQKLQQQIAILAPDLKQKKIAAFEARRDALQDQAQKKSQQIQGGVMAAQAAVEKALAPILENILKERGANMVLDKQAVIYANSPAFDITGEAIRMLDAKLPSIHVTLQDPPTPASAQAGN